MTTSVPFFTLLVLLALSACGDSSEPEPAPEVTSPGDDGARIYATISGTSDVTVIDDVSHQVLKNIAVGEGPAILLNSPDFKQLYSANWLDNSISFIDTTTDTSTRLAVAERPYVITLSPDGAKLYAGLNDNTIAVVDTAARQVVQILPADELPASLIVSPDGQTLYVATIGLGIGPGKLMAISTTDGRLLKGPIEVGVSPAWITIGKDGSKVYTLNFLSDDISVVDTESFKIKKTIDTGASSLGIIGNVTPDGERLYVTGYGTAELFEIDTETDEIVNTIPIHGRPVGIQFDPKSTRLYVTDFGPDSLAEAPLSGSQFLLSGNYTATYPGQVSVYERATGDQIGESIVVGPGATSVVLVPAAE